MARLPVMPGSIITLLRPMELQSMRVSVGRASMVEKVIRELEVPVATV